MRRYGHARAGRGWARGWKASSSITTSLAHQAELVLGNKREPPQPGWVAALVRRLHVLAGQMMEERETETPTQDHLACGASDDVDEDTRDGDLVKKEEEEDDVPEVEGEDEEAKQTRRENKLKLKEERRVAHWQHRRQKRREKKQELRRLEQEAIARGEQPPERKKKKTLRIRTSVPLEKNLPRLVIDLDFQDQLNEKVHLPDFSLIIDIDIIFIYFSSNIYAKFFRGFRGYLSFFPIYCHN
jgi:hypothetical protein